MLFSLVLHACDRLDISMLRVLNLKTSFHVYGLRVLYGYVFLEWRDVREALGCSLPRIST